ncbi:MAG: HAD family phosphatase [Patescibacteria group bacterium]
MEEPIKALIFDAEGVVIDTMHTVWIPADEEFCRRRGQPFPNELGIKMVGSSILEGTRIMKEFFHIPGDEQLLMQERIEIVERLFRKKISFINGFEDFFSQHNDMPAAVATSLKPEYLELAENHLGLRKLFHGHVYDIYTAGTRSKPDPDIFLYAAKQLNVEPGNCLVFEDAPNGIEAARRAGMRSIGLTTTFDKKFLAEATLIVGGFSDTRLSDILKP